MSNNLHLLHNVSFHKKAQLQDTVDELTAGLKMTGYEEFDLSFEDNLTAIASFKDDNHVLVFYVGYDQLLDIKITDLKHESIGFRTKMIRQVSLRDLPQILRVFL